FAVAVTTAILLGLLVVSVWTSRSFMSLEASSALTINVLGHQWWWEVEYDDVRPDQHMLTANELHVPVGKPVVLKVTSRDVIHSFWAPNLQGKRDLIPGYITAIWFQADKEGTYRGQCAEFCGHEHAKMAFYVVAESQEKFNAWLDQQRKPAPDPSSEVLTHGR